MSSNDPDPREWRRNNRIVVIALICGFTLPFAYIAILAKYLPDWLDTLVIGSIFWVCFELLGRYTVGVFKKKRRPYWDGKPIQPPQRNAGSGPSAGDSSGSETPSSPGPRG